MPTLADQLVIDAIKQAFRLSSRYDGYVLWKQSALENAQRCFPGVTTFLINQLVHEHLEKGRAIKAVKETRPEWRHWGFHYDFVMQMSDEDKVYVETVLVKCDPHEPQIHVVSCHHAY